MTDERERLAEVYGRYGESPAKRRAWRITNPGNAALVDELLTHTLNAAASELAGTGRVLDAGCGGGRWLHALARHGVAPGRLHGVDLLGDRVRAARARVPGAEIHEADIRRLPFADGHFALVLLFTALSSLEDDGAVDEAAREAGRVVAPGGLVLVYEPRLPNPFNRRTRHVPARRLARVLGPASSTPLTLAPPLARRLGRLTPRAYPRLSRGPLRTHALHAFRKPPAA